MGADAGQSILLDHPAAAQRRKPPHRQTAPSVPAAPATVTLAAGTKILIEIGNEISSEGTDKGDIVAASVAEAVLVGGVEAIPAGATATGVITERKGKGAFGKSGKLEIEFRQVAFGGRIVAVTGAFRREGKGRPAETAGAVVAAGVFAAFVKGRNAVFEKGERLDLFTTETVILPVVAVSR